MRYYPLLLVVPLLAASVQPGAAFGTDSPAQFLRASGEDPAGYVLSKLASHRVVILGEAHRIRHEVGLVHELVPRLGPAGVDTLAVEMFDAADQRAIDRLVGAVGWDAREAMALMRHAAWPYREYLELLHEAWKYNRDRPAGAVPLRVIGLSPGGNWRAELLPKGETYDGFMAAGVLEQLREPKRRVLVYCGMHHAFARFHQPEMPRERRVDRLMDRAGNMLWRELGEDVFVVLFHRPWQCRKGAEWTRCLPLDGAIDCAAAELNRPVAFDLATSPFGEKVLSPDIWYAMGYPKLRLLDMADGYVWFKPIEAYEGVSLIPLSEFAPDETAFAYVAKRNPMSDAPGLSRAETEVLWNKEAEALRDIPGSWAWKHLARWRDACP